MTCSPVEAGIGPTRVIRDNTLFDVDKVNLSDGLRFYLDDVIKIEAKQFDNTCDVATVAYLERKMSIL